MIDRAAEFRIKYATVKLGERKVGRSMKKWTSLAGRAGFGIILGKRLIRWRRRQKR